MPKFILPPNETVLETKNNSLVSPKASQGINMKALAAGLCACVLLAAPGTAQADVDLYNDDLVVHQIRVQTNNGAKTVSISPGQGVLAICQACTLSLINASVGVALAGLDDGTIIEASGEDVITVEYGIMRIGEDCN